MAVGVLKRGSTRCRSPSPSRLRLASTNKPTARQLNRGRAARSPRMPEPIATGVSLPGSGSAASCGTTPSSAASSARTPRPGGDVPGICGQVRGGTRSSCTGWVAAGGRWWTWRPCPVAPSLIESKVGAPGCFRTSARSVPAAGRVSRVPRGRRPGRRPQQQPPAGHAIPGPVAAASVGGIILADLAAAAGRARHLSAMAQPWAVSPAKCAPAGTPSPRAGGRNARSRRASAPTRALRRRRRGEARSQ